MYTEQHSIPNIGLSCEKYVCNDTFVQIRYLKWKVECVIQGMSILSTVNIYFHRLSIYCPIVMAEVFEREKEKSVCCVADASIVEGRDSNLVLFMGKCSFSYMDNYVICFLCLEKKSLELQMCLNCN